MQRVALLLAFLFITACAHRVTPIELEQTVKLTDRGMVEGTIPSHEALKTLEKLHDDYSEYSYVTAAYVDALRRTGNTKKAVDVLKVYSQKHSSYELPHDIFMSYMRLLLDQGLYSDAQSRIDKRMRVQSDDKARTAELYHILGLTLAGQGNRDGAKKAFELALPNWAGRAGVIEKNIEQLSQL